ncbi:MAG: hypothetical protein M0Z95_08610 [Actinomycetota bacterium]|jgi:hypothetical protein|nr:hypothetical protein [Actinomycetota bacterium]
MARTGAEYEDKWITCTAEGIEVRGYYFPWGTKRIRYSSVKGVVRVEMSSLRGKERIWGTSNPRYWASFDPGRPRKSVAFVFDLGAMVRPFVTPEDPAAFQAAVAAHTGPVKSPPEGAPGPVI